MSKDKQLQPLNFSDYIEKREKSRGIEVYRKQQRLWDHPETLDAEIIELVAAKEAKQAEPSVVNTQNIQTQNIHYHHYHDPERPRAIRTPEPQKKPNQISEGDALLWFFSLVGSVFLLGLLLSALFSGN